MAAGDRVKTAKSEPPRLNSPPSGKNSLPGFRSRFPVKIGLRFLQAVDQLLVGRAAVARSIGAALTCQPLGTSSCETAAQTSEPTHPSAKESEVALNEIEIELSFMRPL